jgi:restriction system protein
MIDLTALMLLTVQALQQLGNSGHIKEIDDAISDLEGLTEDEQAILMPNGKHPRFNYFSAWSRTYLKKAGVVEIVKQGIWALVEGVELPKNYEQTRKLYLQVAKEARQEKKEKAAAASEDELESVEASDDGSSWMDQLLDVLKAMDPAGFERLAQRLLREAGFNKVRVLGQSNDGGIDGVGVLRVNLISFQVYFQCKRYKGSVGSKEIRDFRGALQGRADKGLFITTGTFTSQAYDEATRDGAIAIDLIDGSSLCELLEQLQLGVVTKVREVKDRTVEPAWFDAL